MIMDDLLDPGSVTSLPGTELLAGYRDGTLDPAEVIAAHRSRIEALNPALNAWLSIWPPSEPSRQGALAGVPIGVKDNLDTAGMTTTYASRVHAQHVPDRDATAVGRMRQAGAQIMGKTHLHEYALGVTAENPHFGDCLNPRDPELVAGGSSGGSAVAVATGMVPIALGSDTSGSIRIPASICGVLGLKPTYGRIGKAGCFPEAWSLDHVGVLTRTAADAALTLDVLSGHDPDDPTSLNLPPTSIAGTLDGNIAGLRIGVERDFALDGVDPAIIAVIEAGRAELEARGAELVEVQLPSLANALWAITTIDVAETTAAHRAQFTANPQGYGDDVRELIACGELPSAVDYLQAQQVRTLVRAEFAQTFEQVDLLAGPVLPIRTPRRGQPTVLGADGVEHGTVDELMRLIGPPNLAGLPAASVPIGMLDGQPVGLHLIGPALGERTLLQVARALE